MTMKSSQDLFGSLVQEHKKATLKVQSLRTVIKEYEKIADLPSTVEVIDNRRDQLFKELDHLADIGSKALVESIKRIQELEVQNKDLTEKNTRLYSDLERLRLEYRRQIGVLPKSMISSGKEKSEENVSGKNQNNSPTNAENENATPKKRGAPKGHPGNTRDIPSKIDVFRKESPPVKCGCGCSEMQPTDQIDSKYIEDILPVCVHTTKIEYPRGRCSECGSIVRHKDGMHGPPVSIGPNLSAHLVMLRQMGVTYRKLSQFCTETLGIPLSPSGVLGVVNRSAEILRPTNDEIFSEVRKQEVLNADETGWPIANKSGYIWGFCNSNLAYYHADKSRVSTDLKLYLKEQFEKA